MTTHPGSLQMGTVCQKGERTFVYTRTTAIACPHPQQIQRGSPRQYRTVVSISNWSRASSPNKRRPSRECRRGRIEAYPCQGLQGSDRIHTMADTKLFTNGLVRSEHTQQMHDHAYGAGMGCRDAHCALSSPNTSKGLDVHEWRQSRTSVLL